MRAGLIGLGVLVGLAGCQRVEEVGTYSVTQTAVIEDGGRTLERSVTVRCTILDFVDRSADRLTARENGPPLSLTRGDGSVLVIEGDFPCLWTAVPSPGETQVLEPTDNLGGLLFDDGRRPGRVSSLDLQGGAEGLRLVSMQVTAGPDAEPSGEFERDFPAWEDRDMSRPGAMRPGRWLMVWALQRPLAPGACAGEPARFAPDEASLPECARRAPEDVAPSIPMNGTADAGYDRVDLVDMPAGRRGPDRYPVSALRRARAPVTTNDDGDVWAPEVCVPGFCVSGEQVVAGGYLVDPQGGRVINLSISSSPLSSSLPSRVG